MKVGTVSGIEILAACEEVSTAAEVTGITREYNSLEYGPVCTVPGSGVRFGWGIRMVRNGKLGVAGQWGGASPFELVERCIGSCRYGPECGFSFTGSSQEIAAESTGNIASLPTDQVLDYLSSLQDSITSSLPGASLKASAAWGTDCFMLMNSTGFAGEYLKERLSVSLSATLPTDTGLLQSGCTFETSGSLPSAAEVLEVLLLPMAGESMPSCELVGRKKAVFAPGAVSILLQGLKAGVSGRLLAMGRSPLEEMAGKKVLSDMITVRDMPELPDGAASAPFDSEGTATSNRVLFEAGTFKGFIHDLHSASLCGTETTGSSGRNLGEHSRPVCTNLVLDTCEGNTSNLLKETGTGILVSEVLSAGGGDAASGHFSFDCGRVYLLRKGEIAGYSDGCVITGNVYDALSRVIAVGGRGFRTGSDVLPFLALDGIAVR